MKVTLARDQVAKIVMMHIADNRKAFCVRDGFTVDKVEWIVRDVCGCGCVVIDEKYEQDKKNEANR